MQPDSTARRPPRQASITSLDQRAPAGESSLVPRLPDPPHGRNMRCNAHQDVGPKIRGRTPGPGYVGLHLGVQPYWFERRGSCGRHLANAGVVDVCVVCLAGLDALQPEWWTGEIGHQAVQLDLRVAALWARLGTYDKPLRGVGESELIVTVPASNLWRSGSIHVSLLQPGTPSVSIEVTQNANLPPGDPRINRWGCQTLVAGTANPECCIVRADEGTNPYSTELRVYVDAQTLGRPTPLELRRSSMSGGEPTYDIDMFVPASVAPGAYQIWFYATDAQRRTSARQPATVTVIAPQ